jgi:glycosyltransferase involved in cell wall biosynthesis
MDRRIETHVAYSSGGELEPIFVRAGVRLFQFARGDHKIKSPATLSIAWRLAAYIRRHKIDIVHTHNFNGNIWGILAAKLAGARIVEHVHDFRYCEEEEYRRRRGTTAQFRYAKYFSKWPDRIVVLTRDNVEYLLKHRLCRPERIREMQNGIPLDPPDVSGQSRAALGLPEQGTLIFTPARMSEEKNIDLILEIAPDVIARRPEAQFVIAGDGPLLESLKKRSREKGLERNVHFIGFQADVERLLLFSDIFLLPSFLELHSIALLEALKAAVPVVISEKVGCHDEFITDGKNGFLADPFSKAKWADILVSLLADEALRKRVGASGRELCEKQFDIRNVAKKFEALYEEMEK